MVPSRRLAALAATAAISLHCGGPVDRFRAVNQAIVGGSVVAWTDSAALYLRGPEGACTAALIAPNLAVTARHCVASTNTATFSCTAGGDLILSGNGGGQIGNDNPPERLQFYTSARLNPGGAFDGSAFDALGRTIVSTKTTTACRDDLAFVVLDRDITAARPAPPRIDRVTQVGEAVSVWGYGLTDKPEGTALRWRDDAKIVGVGPDVPATGTQNAPVRAVRIGAVTCQGDSGGPIIAASTGAVVAVVSLGSQAGSGGPFCSAGSTVETVGPRLAAYHDLALAAFRAAGASPLPEETLTDAGHPMDAVAELEPRTDLDDSAPPEDAEPSADTAEPLAPDASTHYDAGGGCALTTSMYGGLNNTNGAIAALVVAALARRRRA